MTGGKVVPSLAGVLLKVKGLSKADLSPQLLVVGLQLALSKV